MSQTYTGNILLTLQSIDNLTGSTVFNHPVTGAVNPTNTQTQLVTLAALIGTTTVYGPGGVAAGVYVKNNGTSGTLTVTWNIGSGLVNVIVLQPQGFILVFQDTSVSPVQQVTLSPSASMPVEYAIWA